MNAAEMKAMAKNIIEHDSAGYAYFRCDKSAVIARAYLRLLETVDVGRLDAIGWAEIEGQKVFRATVIFDNPPKHLTFNDVWKHRDIFITAFDAAKEGK